MSRDLAIVSAEVASAKTEEPLRPLSLDDAKAAAAAAATVAELTVGGEKLPMVFEAEAKKEAVIVEQKIADSPTKGVEAVAKEAARSKSAVKKARLRANQSAKKSGAAPKTAAGAVPPKDSASGSDKKVRASNSGALASSKPVAPVQVVKVTKLQQWAELQTYDVSKEDKKTQDFAKSLGIPLRLTDRMVADHPISHLCRDVAVMRVVAQSIGHLQRATVYDLFGSNRTPRLLRVADRDRTETTAWDNEVGCAINCVLSPNDPVQGDASRYASWLREDVVSEIQFDLVMAVDVYQTPTSGAFTPEYVRKLCRRSNKGQVYVICRKFFGFAGADVCGEGVWIRADSGVVFTPAPGAVPYTPHPDNNWLCQRSVDGLDISELFSVGPYSVFRCAETFRGAVPLHEQHVPCGSVVERDLDMWSRWSTVQRIFGMDKVSDRIYGMLGAVVFGQKMPERRVLMCLPAAQRAGPRFAVRFANGLQIDAALAVVDGLIKEEQGMTEVSRAYPDFYRRIVRGTFKSLLYLEREEMTTDLLALRREYWRTESELTLVRAQASPGPSQWRWTKWAALAVLAALWLYMKSRLRCAPPASVAENTASVWRWLRWNGALALERLSKCFGVAQKKSSKLATLTMNVADDVTSTSYGGLLDKVAKHRVAFAVGEEVLRYISPSLMATLGVWDSVATASTSGWRQGLAVYSLHIMCTTLRMSFGLPGSLASTLLHVWWNRSADGVTRRPASLIENILSWWRGASKSRYQVFLERHAECEPMDEKVSGWDRIPVGQPILPRVSRLKPILEHFRGWANLVVARARVSLAQAYHILDEAAVTAPNRLHPVLITSGLLYQPANLPVNLIVAIMARSHKDPFVDKPPAKVRHATWLVLVEQLVESKFFGPPLAKTPTFAACIAAMGSKGHRIADARAEDVKGNNLKLIKHATLKWNETIPAKQLADGSYDIKPRVIMSYVPIILSRHSKFAKAVSDHFKSWWDGRVLQLFGQAVRFFFVCGYTHAQMCQLGDALISGELVVAVSGDDSVVAWGPLTRAMGSPYGDSDQSSFDQTQDEGPTIIASQRWLRALEVPPELIYDLLEVVQMPYKVVKKELRMSGECGVQMPTGISWTTDMNTISSAQMYSMMIRDRKNPEEVASALGFTIKYHPFDDVHSLTFLRGWWCDSDHGMVWMPLPSAVLKAGKVMRPPREIYPSESQESSVQMTANAIASSYGHIPPEYPIFGPFVQTLLRLGRECYVHGKDIGEGWYRIRVDAGTVISRKRFLQMIEKRYDITERDVLEVEALIRAVDSLPAIVYHWTFARLGAVDYG
jgi:hypothetical protein